MALQARVRLEFLTTDTASFVVHVRSKNLVLRKVIVGPEVFVTFVTVVVIIIMLFVGFHRLLAIEVEAAVWKGALDSIRVHDGRHYGR